MCEAFTVTEESLFEYHVSGGSHILYRIVDGERVNIKSVSSKGRFPINPGDFEFCPREENCGVIEHYEVLPMDGELAADALGVDCTAPMFVEICPCEAVGSQGLITDWSSF